MCTLCIDLPTEPGLPILVAANRDELLARPSWPIRRWDAEPPFLAPRDEQAGGTWLGLNAHGLFVGLTNRAGLPPDPRRASRGELVTWALGHASARALRQACAALDASRFNPFHLLYADRRSAFVSHSNGIAFVHLPLEPGLHVITERSFGAVPVEREARVREAWPRVAPRSPAELERLAPLLAIHDPEGRIGGTCVHAPELGYGTRSSLLLALAPTFEASRLLWAEGPPCETPFVDRSALLRALGR